jgi:hypothetical protein
MPSSPADLALLEVILLGAFTALGYWLGRRKR